MPVILGLTFGQSGWERKLQASRRAQRAVMEPGPS